MKNLNLIPLNNDLNKLQGFIPSLDKNWRNSQRIKSNQFQIETLDAVSDLQKYGWEISGAREVRDKRSRKVSNHLIKLDHPDFQIKNKSGNSEAVASMRLYNSCDGSSPLEMDFGVFRQICSNGMIANTSYSNHKVQHTEKGNSKVHEILMDANIQANLVIDEFNKLKTVELDHIKAIQLASDAARIRFGNISNFDVNQLLEPVRVEDTDNDVWTVFNRIQENLTQSNRLYNRDGSKISGVSSVNEDTRINKALFEKAYALV
jgi:hypothetical protein